MAKYLDDNGLLYFWQQLKVMLANKVDVVSGKGLSTNDYTTAEKNKLSGVAAGAEVNQNAFSNVVVGSTTIAADSKTDTLTLSAGANITLTPNASNDSIEISSSGTSYTGVAPISVSNGEISLTQTIPTKTSDLTNDSQFITAEQIPTEVFVATYNSTTFSQVADAYTAGKYVVMKDASNYYGNLVHAAPTGSSAEFVFEYTLKTGAQWTYTLKSSGWSYSTNTWVNTTRKVNGKALSSDVTLAASDVGALPSSTVIPDSTSDLTNDSGFITDAALAPYLTSASAESTYAKKTDVAGAYIYKGSVATYANLPSTGNTAGDVWNVESTGMNYAWNGTAWDALGESFTIESISNSEIDTILAA